MEKVIKKTDILEDVKELDRKVRSKIVYDKLSDIKKWAREIAELKQKTQFLLEELGVETEDIKRLIDYANNSPDAQLSKDDLEEMKDEVKDMITESKEKVHTKMLDYSAPYIMTSSVGGTATVGTYTASGTTSGNTWITNDTNTSNANTREASDNSISFSVK